MSLNANSLLATGSVTGATLVGSTSVTVQSTTLTGAFLGSLALPASTIVGISDTQTLTAKTLTAPIIATITNTGTLTLPTSTDTLVGRATTDTLTNKTLTSPVIGTITNTGTLTLPTSTDTLVGQATTDTLTHKTLNDSTNNVAANSIYATGGSVVISATAPLANQILRATGPTAASWFTPTTFVQLATVGTTGQSGTVIGTISATAPTTGLTSIYLVTLDVVATDFAVTEQFAVKYLITFSIVNNGTCTIIGQTINQAYTSEASWAKLANVTFANVSNGITVTATPVGFNGNINWAVNYMFTTVTSPAS
jgi:hypothetical protein